MQLPRGDNEEAQNHRNQSLELLADAGVKVMRSDILWHEVEPQQGQFKWDGYDRVMAAANERSIQVMALLVYGNPWATKDTDSDHSYPPDDPQDFARYATEVAERYEGMLHSVEVWNEPNLWLRFWNSVDGGADPARYAALLRATGAALAASASSAPVFLGGTLFHELPHIMPGSLSFVRDAHLAEPDLGHYYDALAYHPYPTYPPQAAPESDLGFEIPLVDMNAQLRAVIDAAGEGDKPMHISEVGWPVYGQVDESLQAAYLIRMHLLALSQGVPTVCWYTLRDGLEPEASLLGGVEHAFGLVRYDYSLKPAYHALKTLNRVLGDAVFVDLEQQGSLYVANFEAPGQNHWTALWSVGEAMEFSVPLASGYQLVEGVSLTGEPIELSGNTVQVSESPSYFRSAP
jgi:hypothetical protein